MSKSPIVLIVCILLSHFCQAAGDSPVNQLGKLYANFTIGGGYKGLAAGAGANIINTNGWGLGYSFLANIYPSKNKPADYKPPVSLFVFSGSGSFNDVAFIHSLLLVKEILPQTKRLRLAISAGPSFSFHQTYHFEKLAESSSLASYSGNYLETMQKKQSLGLTGMASFGYLPTQRFGMQLSAVANINKQHSYAGIQLELLFGKLCK